MPRRSRPGCWSAPRPSGRRNFRPLGLVDEAAVHEIPALPGDDEVAAIAAEQDSGAAADTGEGTDAPAGEQTPESKEG
jgi:large subunit ribosomal protein L3